MKTQCPYCGIKYEFDDARKGNEFECKCGNSWTIGQKTVKPNRRWFEEEITTECPHCETYSQFGKDKVGEIVECPACHQEFVVEALPAPAAPPAAPPPAADGGQEKQIWIRCPHCGKFLKTGISNVKNKTNVMCPDCHETFIPERDHSFMIGGLLLLLIVVSILFALGTCSCIVWKESAQNKENMHISDYAEQVVSARLFNPGGAKFEPYSSRRIRKSGHDTWEVELWCDATNVFGGVIRKTYLVEIRMENGRWFGRIISEN